MDKLFKFGEIGTKGIGGWDEHWWTLVLNLNDGQFYIEHYQNRVQGAPIDEKTYVALSDIDKGSEHFKKAIAILRSRFEKNAGTT